MLTLLGTMGVPSDAEVPAKKKKSVNEAWRKLISAMLYLYLSAFKFCNFWSAIPPICEFICLWVSGDKQKVYS